MAREEREKKEAEVKEFVDILKGNAGEEAGEQKTEKSVDS